jgi:hypothetical protein
MPGQGFTHIEPEKQSGPVNPEQKKLIAQYTTQISEIQEKLKEIFFTIPSNTFTEEEWKILRDQSSNNHRAKFFITAWAKKALAEGKTMNQKEHLLAEAVKSMFNNDPQALGIVKGKPITDPTSRMPHQYEYIMDLFALKIADSTFFESIKSAFYDIHSYKFINDPSFCDSFIRRMKAIGLPHEEINKACIAVEGICEELGASDWFRGDRNWDEKSAGWHKDLAGIRQVSQDFNQNRKQEEPYSGGGPAPKMTLKEAFEVMNASKKYLSLFKPIIKEEGMPGSAEFMNLFRDTPGTTPAQKLQSAAIELLKKQVKRSGAKELTQQDIARVLGTAFGLFSRTVEHTLSRMRDQKKAQLIKNFFETEMAHYMPDNKPSEDIISSLAIQAIPKALPGIKVVQRTFGRPEDALNIPDQKLPVTRYNPVLR